MLSLSSLRSVLRRRSRLLLSWCHVDLSKARRVAVTRPKLSGRRSSSAVLNQVCLGLSVLCDQSLGGPRMQTWRAREWSSWLVSARCGRVFMGRLRFLSSTLNVSCLLRHAGGTRWLQNWRNENRATRNQWITCVSARGSWNEFVVSDYNCSCRAANISRIRSTPSTRYVVVFSVFRNSDQRYLVMFYWLFSYAMLCYAIYLSIFRYCTEPHSWVGLLSYIHNTYAI